MLSMKIDFATSPKFDTGGEVENPSYATDCIPFLKGEVRV
jgi:hypothetical protein